MQKSIKCVRLRTFIYSIPGSDSNFLPLSSNRLLCICISFDVRTSFGSERLAFAYSLLRRGRQVFLNLGTPAACSFSVRRASLYSRLPSALSAARAAYAVQYGNLRSQGTTGVSKSPEYSIYSTLNNRFQTVSREPRGASSCFKTERIHF